MHTITKENNHNNKENPSHNDNGIEAINYINVINQLSDNKLEPKNYFNKNIDDLLHDIIANYVLDQMDNYLIKFNYQMDNYMNNLDQYLSRLG